MSLISLSLSLVLAANEWKSAASFCCKVAALVKAMFCNFYLVKNHKIADTQQPLKLEKKISTYLEFLEF
jgi:hypothetical protein